MIDRLPKAIYNDFCVMAYGDLRTLKEDGRYFYKEAKKYFSSKRLSERERDLRNKTIKSIAIRVFTALFISFFAYQTMYLVPDFFKSPSLIKACVPSFLKGTSYLISLSILQEFFFDGYNQANLRNYHRVPIIRF